jgi:hypothetical protein
MKTKYKKNDITLNGIASEEKYFENTLKALIYSKKISGIKKAQLICFKDFEHKDIECIKLPYEIKNLVDWNFFMMKHLYKFIDTELMINIHDDGFIINPEAWTDEFLNYDYIGALWPIGGLPPHVTEHDRCGNGGFSLRSKRFLEISALYCPFYQNLPEDATVCRVHKDIFLKHGMKFGTNEICSKFSIEYQFMKEYANQFHEDRFSLKTFGFHFSTSDAIKYLDDVSL